jgi:DNA (cytosine-5)-methyltransferase 1
MMTVGSLFSGIGGIELGLERTGGFKTIWQVENDEFCRRVLEKHWPDVRRYRDIRSVGEPHPVDVIVGGFPCQPVSIAGQQRGDADPRWLWPEMRRICEVVRPRWVVVENVIGLLTVDGALAGQVVGDLASLGYCVEWESIQARRLGSLHARERVFFLAYAHEPRLEGVHDESWRVDLQPTFRDVRRGWLSEPEVDRVAYGLPRGLARWRRAATQALGNAVCPPVAEYIGRCILLREET